jgi:glycine dehydrogenase subunit 2
MVRESLSLPELSEPDVIRHYTRLSRRNYGVDTGFYPLGSCTMKYNPRVCEDICRLEGFSEIHPHQPFNQIQSALMVLYEAGSMLCELTGMSEFSMQPAAGAHGELTGAMIMKKYYSDRGENRNKVIVPDSGHGTNPATAAYAGFKVIPAQSDEDGNLDLEVLEGLMDDGVAGLMLTNPNTLGLFDPNIREITRIIHDGGGLTYYDGANMNAIMGRARPGDMGFDIIHLNLHKTFATPHGGGGPGSGPVGVKEELRDYLPTPRIRRKNGEYSFDYGMGASIGRVRAFHGNFGVVLKAYAYMLGLGMKGLRRASQTAVLNANYLLKRLREEYDIPFDRACMHEFVLSARRQKHDCQVSALDIAKRLLDYGVHAPTIYFPLIVEEAMMIEPTETESRQTLDDFARIMVEISRESRENPSKVRQAPSKTPVKRLDETLAARKPVLNWNMVRE